MLLVVLLLADHDVAVHENVVEQEELTGLRPFAAHFRQDALADQHAPGNRQRLAGATEAVLHHCDAARIRLTVDCGFRVFVVSHEIGKNWYCSQGFLLDDEGAYFPQNATVIMLSIVGL